MLFDALAAHFRVEVRDQHPVGVDAFLFRQQGDHHLEGENELERRQDLLAGDGQTHVPGISVVLPADDVDVGGEGGDDPLQLRDWALLTEGLDTVVASNFQRSYRAELERQRVNAALPMDVKKALGIGGIVLASNAPWAPIPEIGFKAQLSGSSLRPLGKGCETYEKKN